MTAFDWVPGHGAYRWVREARVALRAAACLPTIALSVVGEDGTLVDVVYERHTVARDMQDRLVLVPARGTIYWAAPRDCVVRGIRREGRETRLRRPRRLRRGERLVLDRTWRVVEEAADGP